MYALLKCQTITPINSKLMCSASKTLEDDIAKCNITNATNISYKGWPILHQFIIAIVNIVFFAAAWYMPPIIKYLFIIYLPV